MWFLSKLGLSYAKLFWRDIGLKMPRHDLKLTMLKLQFCFPEISFHLLESFLTMIHVSIGIPMMLCSSNHKQAWDTSWFIIVRFWGSMVNFSYTTTRVSSPLPTISTIVAKSTEGALRLFYHFRGFPDWIFIFV